MTEGVTLSSPNPGHGSGDAFDGQLPDRLPKALIQELSQPNLALMLGHIALEWVGIIAAIAISERIAHPIGYAAAIVFIAARQHALGVLMHEGVHFRMCASKWWNDAIAELFCAWPIFLPMRGFRRHHFAHHRHMNTDNDPDFVRKKSRAWVFPKTKVQLATLLLLDVSGLNFWALILMFVQVSLWEPAKDPAARRSDRMFHLTRISFYLVVILALWKFGLLAKFALYWLVPLFTWFAMTMHIRSIAEHFAVPRDQFITHTRTVVPTVMNRWLLVPNNICYHIEHHSYPSVPFFRLPRLHAILMQDPVYRANAHVTYSYWRALTEFCGQPRERVAQSGSPLRMSKKRELRAPSALARR